MPVLTPLFPEGNPMLRKPALFAVAAVVLFTSKVTAGGPPWLCLPVDGVTSENAKACSELLTAKLEEKLSQHAGQEKGVQIHKHKDQSYMTFYMGEDVRLSDIEAALKDSGFSVPRDRLRLFGHVILVVDARATLRKALLDDLEALDHVSVAKSDDKRDLLLVTVDMPYPANHGRPERETIGWDTFQRDDFASDPSTKSAPSLTSRKLPSYQAFDAIIAKNSATLKDIRWSTNYACRPLGAVAAPKPEAVISAN